MKTEYYISFGLYSKEAAILIHKVWCWKQTKQCKSIFQLLLFERISYRKISLSLFIVIYYKKNKNLRRKRQGVCDLIHVNVLFINCKWKKGNWEKKADFIVYCIYFSCRLVLFFLFFFFFHYLFYYLFGCIYITK